MVNDSLKFKGFLDIYLKDEKGAVKQELHVPNLITTAGKNFIADQLSGTPGSTKMTHMAIGTSSTAAAVGDTTLGAELDRNALTGGGGTDSGAVVTFVGDWAAGDGTGAITEAGIFNAASSGVMLARSVFSVINKGAGDTLSITWTVTIS